MICKRNWMTSCVFAGATLLGVCVAPRDASAAKKTADRCAPTPTSSVVVNVKDKGTRGDGRTDDTAAIQKAIDKVAGTGGTVLVPDGIYLIDAVGGKGLALKRDMTLKLSKGATLKTIPNASDHSFILTIANASNVTVVGGTLHGDRAEHTGKTGEWGMGLRIGSNAEHVTVVGVTSKDMWGDGFFIEGAKDVTFCSVTADHNRRQGLSVIEADGVVVMDSVFSNTRGTRPSAGIDLEPDRGDQQITNVQIQHSKFLNNAGAGVLISGRKHTTNVSNVEITHNVFTGAVPIKIEYAPAVLDAAICKNRQIMPRSEPTGILSTAAISAEQVVLQTECGDRRLLIRR